MRNRPVQKIGLIAGSGMLPVYFARGARKQGVPVVAVAIKGEASAHLEKAVDEIHWTGLAQLGKWIRLFKRAGVTHAAMCGGITKTGMFDGQKGLSMLPDLRTMRVWFERLKDRKDHTILEAVAAEFEAEGIPVVSSVEFCRELLASPGAMTRRQPTDDQWADIRFGWPIAKQVAALQIGQTIVVKDETVVAVEGVDGTNPMLRRAGTLARNGFVAIKVAKEGHDERFDIPCVGPDTVAVLRESGAGALAIEAGHTIILDKDRTREDADEARISIVAVSHRDFAGH